jgi:transglutaminase-like putative cysteine protease
MARLRIEHRTEYHYSRPVRLGRHRLVMRPREGHDLRIESMQLDISPAHRMDWSRDVFGNSVAVVDFIEATTLLTIISDVVVTRTSPFPQEEPHEPWRVGYPVSYEPSELTIAAAYQQACYPDDVSQLRDWLDSTLSLNSRDDAEDILFALGTAIKQQINYQRRNEKGVQSPARTLGLATGSCRDMATLMMEAGRALGIAMRFASGYLDCPASIAGRASTHAWIEAYLPGLGWRGFDPTLGEPSSLKHVVVGVSNHPRGVMPISGMFVGNSSDHQKMMVQVKTESLTNDT